MIFDSDKSSFRPRLKSQPKLSLIRRRFSLVCALLMPLMSSAISGPHLNAQTRQTLFGDVKVQQGNTQDGPPQKIVVILYRDGGGEVGRQIVSNRSRYRFGDLAKGDYQLAIEVDDDEVARVRVVIEGLSSSPHGYQQDLEFALKPGRSSVKPGVISAAEVYQRSSVNNSLFQKAQEAVAQKKNDEALSLLERIVASDKLDFQAWTLLGTLYVLEGKPVDAEKAYLTAIELKPTYALALLDLGKLRSSQKRFEEVVDPLTRCIAAQPQSGEANLLLGEAYLQLKQGSKAVPYLNEAARLDKPDAHLRLGWLYNAAGMKDKAAVEYEEFLKKQPNYPDRKKLQEYIYANKKNSVNPG